VKSGERTAVSVVECNEIFKEMETEARFIKKHFLAFAPFDVGRPSGPVAAFARRRPHSGSPAHPALTITYPGGPHVLMVHLVPLPGTEPVGSSGTHDSWGDYGYALYRGIMPQGGASWNRPPELSTT
jgi:hypothetical protein